MALKVFDLQCVHGHVFEGWFASQDDYDAQQQRGLLACPVCSSTEVTKRLSAPRLNMGRHASPSSASDAGAGEGQSVVAAPTQQQVVQWQAAMMRHIREIVRKTENVGVQFAREARRIHEGEAEQRPIRGVATREESEALVADGIAVMPIPRLFDDERLQ